MSFEEQPNEQQKQESENVTTHHTTDDDDDDYYDADPELARNRSKLRILYHAATCPCDEVSDCPAGVVHCCASKRVFSHIITCTAGYECEVPGCQHSRRVWRHYRNCGRNNGKDADAATTSSISNGCDMCSAVPSPYDPNNVCSRFKKTSRLSSRRATTKPDGNASVDVNSVEVAVGHDSRRGGSRDQYDRLPVWRKRNFLHSQQQQYQEQQLQQQPQHEKENATTSTASAVTNTEKIGSKGAKGSSSSSSRSTLRASEASFNQSVRQHHFEETFDVAGSSSKSGSKAEVTTKNPYPLSNARNRYVQHNSSHHQNFNDNSISKRRSHSPPPISRRTAGFYDFKDNFDENFDKNNIAGFSGSAPPFLPKQLPAHPRDAKRRPNGPKPVVRRSSQLIERVDPVY